MARRCSTQEASRRAAASTLHLFATQKDVHRVFAVHSSPLHSSLQHLCWRQSSSFNQFNAAAAYPIGARRSAHQGATSISKDLSAEIRVAQQVVRPSPCRQGLVKQLRLERSCKFIAISAHLGQSTCAAPHHGACGMLLVYGIAADIQSKALRVGRCGASSVLRVKPGHHGGMPSYTDASPDSPARLVRSGFASGGGGGELGLPKAASVGKSLVTR